MCGEAFFVDKAETFSTKGQSFMGECVGVFVVVGIFGVPLKVVGLLKDLATGKILGGKNFKVFINNTTHPRGMMDEAECFCTYFVPDRFGVFQIEIQPEDANASTQQIIVT